MKRITDEHLALLFYDGVPWSKLTRAERRAFRRYRRRQAKR